MLKIVADSSRKMITAAERVNGEMAIYILKGVMGSVESLSNSMEGIPISTKEHTRRRNIIAYSDILKKKLNFWTSKCLNEIRSVYYSHRVGRPACPF